MNDTAEDTRPDYEIARDKLAALMTREGLTVAAVFVPFSQSRNAKPGDDGKVWRSLNWKVTLQRNGRDVLTTDYSAGEAHAPGSKASSAALAKARFTEKHARAELIAWEIETGYPGGYGTLSDKPARLFKAAPIMPDAVDVFSSLSTDADVLNYSTFEKWAGEFGFDPDSRKGEAIYRACLATALAMRAALGEPLLNKAAELAREL